MQTESRRDFMKIAGSAALVGALPQAQSSRADEAKPKRPWQMGAMELAAAIRRKQFTCSQVIRSHFERIEAVNPKLNAVTQILRDTAMQKAKEVDRIVEKGEKPDDQPLLGVPFTVKENIDVAGSATTDGIIENMHNVAATDDPHVAQLRRAGAIPIARTNLPDVGLRWHTDSSLRGATKNPWKEHLTPGGSSGGEAAAIATGMSPLGLGNDYGGSLRFPAQCCGISSIRPSRGRVPRVFPRDKRPLTLALFAVQGPMARHARDLRLALRRISRPDPRDPWWSPAPFDGPKLQQPIRVAVTVDPGKEGVDREVKEGVLRAADALSHKGYVVEHVDPPAVVEAWNVWSRLTAADIRELLLDDIRQKAGKDANRFLEMALAQRPDAEDRYIRDFARHGALARLWSEFQQKFPVIVGPVSTKNPFPVGKDLASGDDVDEISHSLRLVVTANLLGLPAAVVPVGVANGVPQAVQIIGPIFRDDLCLDVAENLEDSLGTITPIDPIW